MRHLWIDGRLSWPVVTAIVFVTVSALAFDFTWRAVTIPIGRLVAYALVIDAAAAALLIFCYYVFVRSRGSESLPLREPRRKNAAQ